MVDKEFIRKQHLREGWSLRKIARQTGMCRKTIRRMLRDSEIPTYVLSKSRPRPSTGPYLEIIRTWLREDLSAPRKQRHTAKRVYDRLVAWITMVGTVEVTIPAFQSPFEDSDVDNGTSIERSDKSAGFNPLSRIPTWITPTISLR